MHVKRSWFSTCHIIFPLFCPCSVMLCKPLPVLGTQSRCHASHGQQLLAWQWMSMNLWKIMKANVIAFKDEKRPTWEKDRQESRILPPTKTVREARKCESDEIRIQPEWQNLFGMPAGWQLSGMSKLKNQESVGESRKDQTAKVEGVWWLDETTLPRASVSPFRRTSPYRKMPESGCIKTENTTKRNPVNASAKLVKRRWVFVPYQQGRGGPVILWLAVTLEF